MTNGDAHPETRRMMEIAIRRLNALEYLILGFAVLLALLAGALTAWMVANLTGAPYRLTWALSSILFFVVPGLVVFRRERRAGRVQDNAAVTASEDVAVSAGTATTGTADVTGEDVTREDIASEDVTEMRDHGGR